MWEMTSKLPHIYPLKWDRRGVGEDDLFIATDHYTSVFLGLAASWVLRHLFLKTKGLRLCL